MGFYCSQKVYIILPCGPGYPFLGQQNGCQSLSREFVHYFTLLSWISILWPTEPVSIVVKKCILSYPVVLDIHFGPNERLSFIVRIICLLSYPVVLDFHFLVNLMAVCCSQEVYIILPCGPGYPFRGQPNNCLS